MASSSSSWRAGGRTAADKGAPPDVLALQMRQVRWESYWRGTGPGTYRVVIAYERDELQTTFTIS
jgi:hypothetical protein